jgi:hypothetical protein
MKLTIIVEEKMCPATFDIKSAYLHGVLAPKSRFWMTPAEGFEEYDKEGKLLQWHVKRSLYGHPAAGYVWGVALRGWYSSHKTVEVGDGSSMFIGEYEGWPMMILLYIDDCLIGAQPEHITEFIAEFESRFAISSMENLNEGDKVIFLGHKIERGHLGIVKINQEMSINKGLAILGLTSQVKSVGAPLQKGLEYIKQDWNESVDDPNYDALKGKPLVLYSDADWAGDPDTRRSTSGHVALLWGLLVAHGSKRQHNISTSTFEAELEACTLAHEKAIYLRDILRDLNVNIGRKVPTLTDSLSLVSGLATREFRPKRKHHDIKVMKIRELEPHGEIMYYYEEGSKNPADLPPSRSRSRNSFAIPTFSA